MLAREATEKDISEFKQRMKERQNQRILDRDAKQAIDIVNKHYKEIHKLHNKTEEVNK